jgi:competence protein ComEA
LALLVALAIGGLGLVTGVPAQAAEKSASAEATELRVNVNTADVEQLTQLKGVGEATAQAIIDFRKENGSFKTVEDLLQVKGIGEKRLATMRDSIVLE